MVAYLNIAHDHRPRADQTVISDLWSGPLHLAYGDILVIQQSEPTRAYREI